MFIDYYKDELYRLKELGREFAESHPVLAPMLSGPSEDTDVERLLEGVAFLTANINRKIDDELPEVLHTLMQMICPHFLRPVPSLTMISFFPKDNLKEPLVVSAGTNIDSGPVDETICRFRTCFDVEISPLSLVNANLIQKSTDGPNVDEAEIKLDFRLKGMNLSKWNPDRLRFYIGGDYPGACDLCFILCHYLKEIRISGNSGSVVLGHENLNLGGFSHEDAIIPYPSNIFPSFRVIQEIFVFPEKFLFLDLNLKKWKNKGADNEFTISFICDIPPFTIPKVSRDRFLLHTVPAINLFSRDAAPMMLEHHRSEFPLRPEAMKQGTYQIFSVDRVSGFARGSAKKREFIPFSEHSPDKDSMPVYNTVFRSSIMGKGYDVYLSTAYPKNEEIPESEIISAKLTCTNSNIPDLLQTGDICNPTSNTPELVSYRNILPPTASQLPPLGGDLLWYLLSHLSMNFISIAETQNFRKLLQFYLFPGERDKPKEIANKRKINSIVSINIAPSERLFKGTILRGQAIEIKTRQDHFASHGDMYIFGSVLDYFLGTYASINTYTSLTFEDVISGEQIKWPVRLGTRPLL